MNQDDAVRMSLAITARRAHVASPRRREDGRREDGRREDGRMISAPIGLITYRPKYSIKSNHGKSMFELLTGSGRTTISRSSTCCSIMSAEASCFLT